MREHNYKHVDLSVSVLILIVHIAAAPVLTLHQMPYCCLNWETLFIFIRSQIILVDSIFILIRVFFVCVSITFIRFLILLNLVLEVHFKRTFRIVT